MRFCVLASGSHGNATYVEDTDGALLIDCGITARQCMQRMQERNIDPATIKGIIITHEHNDHIKGLPLLAARLKIPVLTSPKTWAKLNLKAEFISLRSELEIEFAGFKLRPFNITHDACDPLALVLASGKQQLGYCTDLGEITSSVYDNLKNCSGVIIESNHQPALLARGPYPAWLKSRVASPQGHLSNQEAMDLLESICTSNLQTVVAAHLSQVNNSPALLRDLWQERINKFIHKPDLYIAGQDTPLPIIQLPA
ncbi:MAG: MBL fold metallo-hydrolase [Desulfarculales bacterium]|nr:MBL fold metallo-hydrolase [Desulfarculales bacterium]